METTKIEIGMKKFRPILFSTAMVQALLGGRKLQTRRAVKDKQALACIETGIMKGIETLCPYGKVGDVLWVRETFAQDVTTKQFVYKASADEFYFNIVQWKPSIHMPFEAARIFLQITNIKIERLQDISEQEAILEGIGVATRFGTTPNTFVCYDGDTDNTPSPRYSFKTLWNSINGVFGWDGNPWVWVIEFKRIEKVGALQ